MSLSEISTSLLVETTAATADLADAVFTTVESVSQATVFNLTGLQQPDVSVGGVNSDMDHR